MADEVLRSLVRALQEVGARVEARGPVTGGHGRARGTCRLHQVQQGGAGVQYQGISHDYVPQRRQLLHL